MLRIAGANVILIFGAKELMDIKELIAGASLKVLEELKSVLDNSEGKLKELRTQQRLRKKL